MRLSKLQNLNPSAIDKSLWSLFRLWPVKKEESEAFLTPLRILQTLAAFMAAFTSEE
jgi:hypothetical protein